MSEVQMGGARGDDQIVVGDVVVIGDHPFPVRIDLARLRQQHAHVLLMAEDPSNGGRHVARRQGRRRHLVQQRLKQMVVVTVDEGHTHVGATQCARGEQTAETAAENHDVGKVQGFLNP